MLEIYLSFKDLMVGISIIRVFHLSRNLLFFFGKEVIKSGFTDYSNETCSLFSPLPIMIFNNSLLGIILLFKSYAKFNSNRYLDFDHERVRKIILFLILLITIAETIISFALHGSFCTKFDVYYTHQMLSLEINEESINFAFPIGAINFFFVLFVHIVYYLINRHFHKRLESRFNFSLMNIFTVQKHSMEIGKTQSKHTSTTELTIVDLEIAADESNVVIEEDQANVMNTITVDEAIIIEPIKMNTIKLDELPNKKKDEKDDVTKLVFHKQMRALCFVTAFVLLATMVILSLQDSNKLWIIHGLKEAITYVVLVTWVNKSEIIQAFAKRKLSNWKVSSEI